MRQAKAAAGRPDKSRKFSLRSHRHGGPGHRSVPQSVRTAQMEQLVAARRKSPTLATVTT